MARRSPVVPLAVTVGLAVVGVASTLIADWRPQLGLDLQGGASVVLEPVNDVDNSVLDTSIEIIRNRVDALGVAEPEIARQGGSILVELPGIDDANEALELVGQTAELRFRPVLQQLSPDAEGIDLDALTSTTTVPGETTDGDQEDAAATTAAAPTTAAGATDSTTATTAVDVDAGPGAAVPGLATATTAPSAAAATTVAPTDSTAAPSDSSAASSTVPTTRFEVTSREDDVPEATVVLPELDDGEVVALYQLGPSTISGSIVEDADAVIDQAGRWIVELVLKGGADGIDAFNAVAAQCNPPSATCPTGQLAIVLDGVVVSAPVIQQSSFQRDQISISGRFGEREAKDLALVLRYGALPVELEPQAVQSVSATLGEDSLRAGIIAGIVGLLLVVAFMFVYYRALAITVVAGLVIVGAYMWTAICWLGETRGLALTLAGATGIIMSIGVAIDSYVVYFERMKDEIRGGRTTRGAAERSFTSAFRTMLAADSASFIGAFLLWWLTIGSVRGFAFFLGLSTVFDLFVVYWFVRPLVLLMARRMRQDRALGVVSGEAVPTAEAATPAPVGAAR